MLVNRLDVLLIELAYLCLSQPEAVILKAALDVCFAVLGLIEDQIRSWGGLAGVSYADSPPIISRIRSVTCFSSASITSSGLGGVNT